MAAKKKPIDAKRPRLPPRGARSLASRHRLMQLAHAEPEDERAMHTGWTFEVFWDGGYRLQASKLNDEVVLFADDMREWTGPAAAIALALKDLPAPQFVIDGWLCVLGADGKPDFEALKTRITTGEGGALVFMLSDLWALDAPLASLPLAERRAKLKPLIPEGHRTLLAPQELEGSLEHVKRSLTALGLGGVLARTHDRALVVSADDEPLPLVRSLSAAPKFTNQDKVLYPRDGYTKTDLVGWYREVAPILLKHMHRRPIVAQRWPDGIDEFTWFQHRAPPRAPDYLRSAFIDGDRRILIENEDALLWMVNQAALTFHGWASRMGTLANPDWAIIDLDPGTKTTWAQTIEVAQAVRALLELLEVHSVVKTSGQKGIHIIVPIAPGHTAAQTFEFSQRVCGMVAALKPELISLEAETEPRKGRLYLDCVQNYQGKTLVLPYSVRGADGAPISMPVKWSEVTEQLDPRAFTIRTGKQRLDAEGDLFAPTLEGTLQLDPVIQKLRGQ
ncbi:MAG: non-homologous end-joining DNA ligase [Archangium sp.]